MVLILIEIAILVEAILGLVLPAMARAITEPIVYFVKGVLGGVGVVIHGLEWLTGKRLQLEDWFARSVATLFVENWRPLRNFFAGHGEVAHWNAHAIARNAVTLGRYAQWNTTVAVPRAIRDTTGPIGKRVTAIERQRAKAVPPGVTGPVAKTIATKAAITTIPKVIQNDIAAIEWLKGHQKLIDDITRITPILTNPHPIPVAHGGTGVPVGVGRYPIPGTLGGAVGAGVGITGSEARTNARLRRLEKLLGVSGMTAAMALVLGLPLGRMLKCNHFKALKRLPACGPGSLLAGLAGLFADILAFSAICQLLPVMEKGLELVEPAIVSFTSGAAAKLCSGNYKKPAAVAVPALRLQAFTAAPTLHLP